MPRRGATLRALIGWQGQALVDKGTYKIDEVEHGGARMLTIRGKSADLRGGMNKTAEQSWHQTTVSDIVAPGRRLLPAHPAWVTHPRAS